MRIVPPIDKSDSILRFAGTPDGSVFFGILAGLLLQAAGVSFWWVASLAMIASAFAPAWRRWISFIASVAAIATNDHFLMGSLPQELSIVWPAGLISSKWPLVLRLSLICGSVVLTMALYAKLSLRLHLLKTKPLFGAFMIPGAIVLALGSGAIKAAGAFYVWAFLLTFVHYFWGFGYLILSQQESKKPASTTSFAFLHFFSAGTLPTGKHWDFFARFDGDSPRAHGRIRLKGIKLIYWALVLRYANALLQYFFFSRGFPWPLYDFRVSLGFPPINDAFQASMLNVPLPIWKNWLALALNFLDTVCGFAVTGHIAVGCVRLLGYDIPRNMWRPFEALTLADYWNRFFYYYKEFLADFFFYPAFTRYFRKNIRIRLVFATFCAVGIGNCLFHMMREISLILVFGFVGAVQKWEAFAIYSLVLAGGLSVSQWRRLRGWRPPSSRIRRALCRTNVFLFFALTHIFTFDWFTGDIRDNLRFLLVLFGLRMQ